MIRRHRTNKPMQRVRLNVPCKDTPALLENVYELYTLVTDRWKLGGLTIWMWSQEVDVQRRPIYELVNRALGTDTGRADVERCPVSTSHCVEHECRHGCQTAGPPVQYDSFADRLRQRD